MLFPKLYNFFRRSKSDTALAVPRKAKSQDATTSLKRRSPISSSFIDMNAPSGESPQTQLSTVLASVPVEPVSLPPRAETVVGFMQPQRAVPPALFPQDTSLLVAALKTRVIDLEKALRTRKEEQDSAVSSLQQTLEAERTALQEARASNGLLTEDITKLQADVMQTRGELYTALNYQLRFTKGSESERNRVLLQENDRLLRFVKLLISCGGHNSVLGRSWSRIEHGCDPEESLVEVIKSAMEDPGSVWRRLLDPLVGMRSPQDYLAQTKCTLVARRESRDWQKRARFWKGKAREDGQHVNTVTPSVSQLSDIALDVTSERKVVLDNMLEKLRHGSLSLVLDSRASVVLSQPQASRSQVSFLPSDSLNDHSAASEQQQPRALDSGHAVLTTIVESASESDAGTDRQETVVEDTSLDSLSGPDIDSPTPTRTCSPNPTQIGASSSAVPAPTLEPLASVSFRESYSIKSVSSRRRRSRHLTPSNSNSSQDSHISKLSDRKAKVLAATRSISLNQLDTSSLRESVSGPSGNTGLDSSLELTLMLSETLRSGNLLPSTSSSKPEPPKSVDGTTYAVNADPSISRSQAKVPPQSTAEPKPLNVSAFNLITPPRQLPARSIPSPSPSVYSRIRTESPSTKTLPTPTSSPETKKSKLPVLRLASAVPRVVRRLSISKPVLVGTTNAAADPQEEEKGSLDGGQREARAAGKTGGAKGQKANGKGKEVHGEKENVDSGQSKLPTAGKSKLGLMSPKAKTKMKGTVASRRVPH